MATLRGIVQVALSSGDPAGLAAFYRDVLGCRPLFETNGMHFLDAGAVRLMVGPTYGQPVDPGGGILYFEPENFGATEAELEAKGIAFLSPAQPLQREDGRELALRGFRDPEGRMLAIMGWRPVPLEAARG